MSHSNVPTWPATTYLVGIGFSAPDRPALLELAAALPPDAEMAFVLAPSVPNETDEDLADRFRVATKLDVSLAADGMELVANRVFVPPAGVGIVVRENRLHFVDFKKQGNALQGPLDTLFRSMAEFAGPRAAGVVMPCVGQHGLAGLRAISERGGITLAALPGDEGENSSDGSMLAGVVDRILTPDRLAEELSAYARDWRSRMGVDREQALRTDITDHLASICEILQSATGHNFKHYRTSTLTRRVQRRMQVQRLGSASEYAARIRSDSTESELLFREFLIGVTAFFRDPEAFEALSRRVIPELVTKSPPEGVRVWVPGCATGEEAYSLAILFLEQMELSGASPKVQIFASDLDEVAIETARSGVYPASIAEQMSPERLRKFFERRRRQYVVSPDLRRMCLFSQHNVISDPPFSRMDLISCRNLLIYFGPHLQKKLMALFHFGLRPGGYLFLGPSESMATHVELFRVIDARNRISQRKLIAGEPARLSAEPMGKWDVPAASRHNVARADLGAVAGRMILDEHAPAFAVINEQFQVLYLSHRVDRYLRPGAGPFENSIIKMARSGLGVALRAAIHDAVKNQRTVVHERASVRDSEAMLPVKITVQPMPPVEDEAALIMVIFEDRAHPAIAAGATGMSDASAEDIIEQLEKEVANAREDLEKAVQELESTNQEIKSSNEELRSMNEELQSANEELETSKEEIQSALDALGHAHSDLENLLASTRIATIFLDEHFQIHRFTPAAAQIYNLISGDVGRPLTDITHNAISMPPLPSLAEVAARPEPIEEEIRLHDGYRFVRRVLPYRTREGVATGLVVTFIDATDLRNSEEQARQRLAEIQTVYNAAPAGLCVLDTGLRFVRVNERFAQISSRSGEAHVGRPLRELIPALATQIEPLLKNLLQTGEPIAEFDFTLDSPDEAGPRRSWLISAHPLRFGQTNLGVNLVAQETTARRVAERRLAAEHAISKLLAASRDFDAAVPAILEALCRELDMDLAELWCPVDSDTLLACRQHHLRNPGTAALIEAASGRKFARGEGLPGQTWSRGVPICLSELADPSLFIRTKAAQEAGIRTGSCLPILIEDECAGVICVYSRRSHVADGATLDSFTAIGRLIGQFVQRTRAETETRRHAQTIGTVNRVNLALAAELNLDPLVQAVTDAGTELTGAQFGAFFYNVVDAAGEKYMLYTISGVPAEKFADFPMPRNTELFATTFEGKGAVRIDDVHADPRYGKSAPYFGMPEGHLPVRSYLAVPVISRDGSVIGGLFFGHENAGVFAAQHEDLINGIAVQAAIAVDNARLYADRAQLAAIVDTTQDAVIGEGLDGTIRSWNQGAVELFGYTAEEAIGQNLSIIVPPEKMDELERTLARIGGGESVAGLETERITKAGRRLSMLLTVSPLLDHSGRPAGASVIARDISERKAAERALRESEERFRNLADTAPVLIWMSDANKQNVYVNRQWLEFTGRTFEEELGERWIERVHPDDLHALQTCIEAFAKRESFSTTFRLRRGDGEYRWLIDTGTPRFSPGGEFLGFIGSCLDVTEHRRADIARAQLAAIVDSSDDAIVSKDLNGVIQTWNPGAQRLFGYGPEEAIGRHITLIVPPDRRDEERTILARLRSGQRIDHFETVRVTKDGRRIHASLSVSPIRDSLGRIVGAAKVARDIGAQKGAEAALREYAGRLAAILNTVVDGILTIDENGAIESANPAAVAIFGYEPQELIGQNVRMLMPEPYHSEHDDYLARYLATGERKIIGIGREVIGRRKSGATFPMELSVSETHLADGSRVFTGLVRDISERKRSEAALREFAGRLAAIFDTVVDGIVTIDDRGTIESANPAAIQLFGYDREELVGQNVKMLMPEPYTSEHDGYLATYLATGIPRIIGIGREVVGRRKDGSTFPMELAVSETRLAEGRVFTGLVRDVTARKQAERNLQETLYRVRFLSDTASQLMFADDPYQFLDMLYARIAEQLGMDVYFHYVAEGEDQMRLAAYGGVAESETDRLVPLLSEQSLCGQVARTGQVCVIDDVQQRKDPQSAITRGFGIRAYVCHPLVARGRLIGTLSFGSRNRTGLDADTIALIKAVSDLVAAALERKRAEDALRESEGRLRFTLDSTRVGTWEWEVATGRVEWSENLEAIHNLPAGSFAGTVEALIESVHIKDRDRVRAALNRALETGSDFQVEHRVAIDRVDGPAWVESRGRMFFDAFGRPNRMAGITAEVTERKRAEHALAVLAEAGGALAGSLDYKETLAKVANLIVPALADWCIIDVADEEGELQAVAIAHEDPAKVEYARELRRRYPPRPSAKSGAVNVMRTGRSEVFTEISDALLRQSTTADEHLEALRGMNLRSGIVVPLIARGRAIGAMTLLTDESRRRFTELDLPLLEEFARSCALAIDNARLYRESQRELAERIRADRALRESEERLRLALIGGGMGAWELNLENNQSIWDAKMVELVGFEPQSPEHATRQLLDRIHHEDRDRVERRIAAAIRGEAEFDVEFRFVRPDGSIRWLAGLAVVVRDPQGEARRMIGLNYDISDRKEAERLVRESEERYRRIFETAQVSIWEEDFSEVRKAIENLRLRGVTDLRTHCRDHPEWVEEAIGLVAVREVNEASLNIFEARDKSELTQSLAAIFLPETRNIFVDELAAIFEGQVVFTAEARLRTLTGRTIDALFTIRLPFEEGDWRSVLVTVIDITERKLAEERQQMLLAELSHRVKNTLATVQSIATQTVLNCETPARFREAFEARLHSLAHTHSLLVRGQWRGADLRAIVAGELSPHATADSEKVRIKGPRLYLSPKAALSLHLVFHELATNAAKYGALSGPAGHVEVQWELVGLPAGRHLRLTWTESGGPRVTQPVRRGFGSTVIEKSVEYELDGITRVEFRENGLSCEFLIPWSETVGFLQSGALS